MLAHHSPTDFARCATLVAAALAGLAWSAAHPQTVYASDPMGIYTLVSDVVIETVKPGEPARVRVYGVTALSYRPRTGENRQRGVYSEPAEGYLYFACPEAKAEICRMEWSDLQKAIGDERCASYGDRYLTDPRPNGRLRPLDEPAADPDPYPIGQGVTMTEHGSENTCDAVRKAAANPSPPPATAATAGSYLPNAAKAADPNAGATALAARRPPPTGADDGSAGGTAPRPSLLTLLAIVGLGALGAATAFAWSRQKRG